MLRLNLEKKEIVFWKGEWRAKNDKGKKLINPQQYLLESLVLDSSQAQFITCVSTLDKSKVLSNTST